MQQYDIVLLPEPKLADAAQTISASLARFDTLFSLDDTHAAHLSVYYGVYFSDENLTKAVEQLRHIAMRTKPLHVRADHYNQAHGYIGVHCERSAELVGLQAKIVDALNALRSVGPTNMHKSGPAARANVARYGWEGVGELYEPHMTFTRFNDRTVEHLDALPDVQSCSGKFTKLAIFELGPNGTCVRNVATFALK